MITLVVGPPGSGKGLFLMRVVADELLTSDRHIVTNFALKIPELAEWFKKQHGEADVDVFGRVHVLNDEEIRNFFLYTIKPDGTRFDVPEPSKEDLHRDRFQDYQRIIEEAWPGITYIIDESDLIHGSAEWQKRGKPCNFYHKQHRKLSHMVYHCCQATDQMEKQIRMVTEQTIVLKNLTHRRMGLFRAPAGFQWMRFYKVPGPSANPEQTGYFRMPLQGGLENCYNTAAGVGMSGTGARADKANKAKGLHWAWMFVILIACIAGVPVGFKVFQKVVGKLIGTIANTPTAAARAFAASATNEPPVRPGQAERAVPPRGTGGRDVGKANLSSNKPSVFVTGIVEWKGQKTVYLSDGSAVPVQPPFCVAGKRSAMIAGVLYSMRGPAEEGHYVGGPGADRTGLGGSVLH